MEYTPAHHSGQVRGSLISSLQIHDMKNILRMFSSLTRATTRQISTTNIYLQDTICNTLLLLVIGIYDPLIAHCEVAGMEALLGIQREVGQIAPIKPEPAVYPSQVYILHFPVWKKIPII